LREFGREKKKEKIEFKGGGIAWKKEEKRKKETQDGGAALPS